MSYPCLGTCSWYYNPQIFSPDSVMTSRTKDSSSAGAEAAGSRVSSSDRSGGLAGAGRRSPQRRRGTKRTENGSPEVRPAASGFETGESTGPCGTLQRSDAAARLSANDSAAFMESCAVIGRKDCDNVRSL